MTNGLPTELRAAIARRLEGVSRTDLARAAAGLSAAYRQGGTSKAGVGGADAALAYLVARMPATYAAVTAALTEVAARLPGFAPASSLDLGAGPGTATFAAEHLFGSLTASTLVEPHAGLRGLAAALMAESASVALKGATIHDGDARRVRLDGTRADLVIASYVLAETDARTAREIAATAIALAGDAVLFVEPGTPAGFAKIRTARDMLIAAGLTVVAPCPGHHACPMAGSDWCHFSVRLQRSRDHMILKDADVPFEDERFAYVAATRRKDVTRAGSRVLVEPEVSKGAVALKLCTPQGLEQRRVPRGDKSGYKAARKLAWGDVVPATAGDGDGCDT
jgi:ribosomal protein RSM22 (predicted rRNA methylase)